MKRTFGTKNRSFTKVKNNDIALPSADVHLGHYSRGYLPHIDHEGLVQHITFHLSDSLPRAAVEQIKDKLRTLPENKRAAQSRERLHELLDRGLGSCILRRPECAAIVEQSLIFGDGSRYRLLAWVVMPNHVHVLIEQVSGWKLSKIVQSWKRHMSREIRRLESAETAGSIFSDSKSAVWHRDYWDRYVRDQQHYRSIKWYIENNPVKAGLISSPEEWLWGSARLSGNFQ